MPQNNPAVDTGTGKRVRIGIVGGRMHVRDFGRIMNVERRFPGVEVVAVWGEPENIAYTRQYAQAGAIPRLVDDPSDLLDMVDAAVIVHQHAQYHVAAARPFVDAGIPTFVDKPFCYRVPEGRDLLELARYRGTPVTSFSMVGFGPEVDDMAAQVRALAPVSHAVIAGRSDIHSPHGGVFFYGIHVLERLFGVFGDDVETVRATRHRDQTTVHLCYRTGMLATMLLHADYRWNVRPILCTAANGLVPIEPRIQDSTHLTAYAAIVRMFQTGREPRPHDRILKPIAVLEAIERSLTHEGWENIIL